MLITGVTVDQFTDIVARVSLDYGGNLIMHSDAHAVSRRSARVRVAVRDSRGDGARRSWTGRHIPAPCWHAYRDVLSLLFEIHPTARVRTSMALYAGRTGFYLTYPLTAYVNVGSQVAPVTMPELCDCPASRRGDDSAPVASIWEQQRGWEEWEIGTDVYRFKGSDIRDEES